MILSYIHQGGPIAYILLIMNFVGITFCVWKYIVFRHFKNEIPQRAQEALNRILKSSTVEDAEGKVFQLAREGLSILVFNLERGLGVIKSIAAVSPLLGLLGTALGVLTSFSSIAEQGLKNPTLFAGGISLALVTTVAGLIVSIPHLVFYNYFNGVLNSFEVQLEEKLLELYLARGQGEKS